MAQADCATDHLHITAPGVQMQFTTEVADNDKARQRGLMFREHLPLLHSMIFVFDQPAPRSFWMKNTLIPLDIMFFDADGVLLNIAENAVPGDLTPLPSIAPAQYVVEIQGGLARMAGIKPGAMLTHAALKKNSQNTNCLH